MNSIIDQTNDPGFAYLPVVIKRFPNLREFAKTANLDIAEFEELPDQAFAWPGQRRYPIHTPEHAALSLGYSKLANSLPSDVEGQLVKAAAVQAVPKDILKEVMEKVAEVPAEEFLLPERQRFRVKCAADVSKAEEVYHTRYRQLSIEDRAEAGYRLMKFAEQHDVCLSPSTVKLAGFTMTSTRVFKDWMCAREEAATKLGSALSTAFHELAEKYANTEPLITNRPDQIKLAQLVHTLDKQANLTQYYGKKLPDPLQTVFNTKEVISDYTKIGSALHNSSLLASLPLSFWEDALGEDIAKEIAPDGEVDSQTLSQILPTLPADLKTALETQLAAYNR